MKNVHRPSPLPASWRASIFAAGLSIAPVHAAQLTDTQAALARSEILQTFNWSMIAFDNKDYVRFLPLFAADATFAVVDPDPRQNHDFSKADMVKMWNHPAKPSGDRHFTSNISISVKDAAHATLNGYFVWLKPGADGSITPAALGSYDITLVKLNGQWLFEHYELIHGGASTGASPLE
jgi:hypothetical protein